MQFVGRIKANSYITRDWRGKNRSAGTVSNVGFQWDGKNYVTGTLSPAQFGALSAHPHIEFEATGITLPPLPMPIYIAPPETPEITDEILFGPTK